jgi:hypothetical protein
MKKKSLPRTTIEPWEAEISRVFEPPKDKPLGRVMLDFKKAFPADRASRWMMGLLAARNDLSITLKLLAPFLVSPTPTDDTRVLYRASHTQYFWRLLMSQVYEVWTVYNQRRGSDDPAVVTVRSDERVKKTVAEIARALGDEFAEGHKPGRLMQRCRVATFHYYDDEGDSWEEQLELIEKEPFFILSDDSNRAVDTRYIVADEWINSRLGPVGYGNREMHEKSIKPAASLILSLVDTCALAYLKARGVKGKYEVMPPQAAN